MCQQGYLVIAVSTSLLCTNSLTQLLYSSKHWTSKELHRLWSNSNVLKGTWKELITCKPLFLILCKPLLYIMKIKVIWQLFLYITRLDLITGTQVEIGLWPLKNLNSPIKITLKKIVYRSIIDHNTAGQLEKAYQFPQCLRRKETCHFLSDLDHLWLPIHRYLLTVSWNGQHTLYYWQIQPINKSKNIHKLITKRMVKSGCELLSLHSLQE